MSNPKVDAAIAASVARLLEIETANQLGKQILLIAAIKLIVSEGTAAMALLDDAPGLEPWEIEEVTCQFGDYVHPSKLLSFQSLDHLGNPA